MQDRVSAIESPPASTDDRVDDARRVAVSSVILTAGEVGSRVATLVLYVVMARAVSAGDFGDFVSAASLALLVFIAAFGVDYTTTKYVARKHPSVGEAFWNSLLVKLVLGGAMLAIVVSIAVFGGYSDGAIAATVLLGVATIVEMLSMSVYAVYRGVERAGPIARTQVVQRFCTAIGGIVALALGAGIVTVAAIWLASGVLAVVLIVTQAHRHGLVPSGRVAPQRGVGLLRESFGLGLSSVFGAALWRLDVIALGLYKPSTEVAIYGAAYRLFESALIITSVLGLASFPLLARIGPEDPEGMAEAFGHLMKLVLAITLPIAVVLVLFADPVMEAMYGDEYAGSAEILQILAPTIVLTAIFGLCSNVLAAQGRQGAIVAGLASGAVLNLVLNVLLIPAHGAQGAAVAMTGALLMTSGLLVALVRTGTARFQARRFLIGPLAATAAAATAGYLAGTGAPVLLLVGVTYVATLALAENRAAPADFEMALQILRRRSIPT